MSVTDTPVTPGPTVVFTGGVVAEPQSAKLYTVGLAEPERIESVYMQVDTPVSVSTQDVLSLQLVDASGVVMWEKAAPALRGIDNATFTAFVCWSRLGNDTAQLPAFEQIFANDAVRRAWVNLPLPDFFMKPNSYVNLLAWIDDGGEAGSMTITNIAVTTLRAGSASATTTLVPPNINGAYLPASDTGNTAAAATAGAGAVA